MKKFVAVLLSLFLAAGWLAAGENNWFAGKFPESLINTSGKKVNTAEALNGKMVLVYFSASWCGPCRGFTPELVKFYKKTAKKNNMELVFVSFDRSQKDMAAYMKKDRMPWLAISFEDSAFGKKISNELKVRGIPTLAVFSADGKLISTNARWDVVIQGDKAVKAWLSDNYKPLTFEDYKNKSGKRRSRKKR